MCHKYSHLRNRPLSPQAARHGSFCHGRVARNAQRLLQYAHVPSPVGHMLGGMAAGWLVAGRPTDPAASGWLPRGAPGWWRPALLFALVGAAPDLDLLVGTHNTYTHSLGAVVATGAAVRLLAPARGWRLALACAAAVASHILLDWLGNDTTPPLGIMALWPFTREFYLSPVPAFMAITRRYWLPGFYRHNTLAVLREVLMLGPLVLLVARWRSTPVEQGRRVDRP
jgi:inner membrane protein